MVEFIRNSETGILEAWKNGKYIGDVITMGDEVSENGEDGNTNVSDH